MYISKGRCHIVVKSTVVWVRRSGYNLSHHCCPVRTSIPETIVRVSKALSNTSASLVTSMRQTLSYGSYHVPHNHTIWGRLS